MVVLSQRYAYATALLLTSIGGSVAAFSPSLPHGHVSQSVIPSSSSCSYSRSYTSSSSMPLPSSILFQNKKSCAYTYTSITSLLRESKKEALFFAEEVTTSPPSDTIQNTPSSSPKSTWEDKPQEILLEANDALTSVGWSAPMTAEELTSNDPFVQRINASIQQESGVSLEELLNPAKVVNLERDLVNLRAELAALTGNTQVSDFVGVTTEEVDNGGGGPEADRVRKQIEKKERDLFMERRAVFRGWLKNVFLGQAILSLGLSWVMVNDPNILFGQFDWFRNTRSMDVSIQVLGFWWWWLFIVPSLRSRRPKGFEKKALDIAFLGTPAVSLLAPVATKDTVVIWCANLAVVLGAYAFAYVTYQKEEEQGGGGDDPEEGGSGGNAPAWLKFVYKSLDFGSGRERGARN